VLLQEAEAKLALTESKNQALGEKLDSQVPTELLLYHNNSSHNVIIQTGSGVCPTFSPKVKQVGYEADHSPQVVTESRNHGSIHPPSTGLRGILIS
jgi:hypothetical protein